MRRSSRPFFFLGDLMAHSASLSSRRMILFSTAFAGSLVSLLSLWTVFFTRLPRWRPLTEYLAAALPSLVTLLAIAALYRMRRAPGSGAAEEQAPTTLAEARFLAATETGLDAFFLLDAVRTPTGLVEDFTFTYLNRKARALFGLAENRGVGDRLCELYPSFHLEGLFTQFESAVLTGSQSTAEFALREQSIPARRVRSSVLKLGNGVVVTASDRSETRQPEAASGGIGHNDALTGLPGRALLHKHMQQAIEHARTDGRVVALLLLDLDGFKQIQAELGHGIGDYALNTIAQRLKNAIRATDSVFRTGAEQFAILYTGPHLSEPMSAYANQVMLSLLPPIAWQRRQLALSARIGVALYPECAADAESLLEQAGIALSRTKQDRAADSHEELQLTAV